MNNSGNRKLEECDGVLLALRQSKMLPFFKDLFKIYGLNDLDDLTTLDEALVNDLTETIQANGFPGSADLTCRSDQLMYLGQSVPELRKFKFTPLDRRRLVETLPVVASSILAHRRGLRQTSVKRSRPEMENGGFLR